MSFLLIRLSDNRYSKRIVTLKLHENTYMDYIAFKTAFMCNYVQFYCKLEEDFLPNSHSFLTERDLSTIKTNRNKALRTFTRHHIKD